MITFVVRKNYYSIKTQDQKKMKVLKFGGTSVGSAARMKEVARLICDGNQKIVVLSAMSGTTNSLVEISDYFYKSNTTGQSNASMYWSRNIWR